MDQLWKNLAWPFHDSPKHQFLTRANGSLWGLRWANESLAQSLTVVMSCPELYRARNQIGVVTAHKTIERLFRVYTIFSSIVAWNITFQVNKHLSSSGTKLILLIALIFFLSDVKQEPCKHWRLDRWEADENNPVLFWQKKICGIYCHMSLISISQKKTCSHIKCVQRYFRSEAGNLKVCYQIQVRLPFKRRSLCYGANIYWATVRRNVT